MAGISKSFKPGMIGATITRTGTPASASCRTARSRAAGVLVRGSIVRASSASSVVIDKATLAVRSAAICRRMSRSRVTSAFLVMIAIGCRASQATSKQPRVRRNSRSAG